VYEALLIGGPRFRVPHGERLTSLNIYASRLSAENERICRIVCCFLLGTSCVWAGLH
jgi:hypothetical protein